MWDARVGERRCTSSWNPHHTTSASPGGCRRLAGGWRAGLTTGFWPGAPGGAGKVGEKPGTHMLTPQNAGRWPLAW